MESDFQLHLLKTFPFIKEKRILLAISGGLDSVVLGYLCQNMNLDFALAHCNFLLRGEESEEDENFVKSLGEKWGREVFVKKVDTKKISKEQKLSIQIAARKLRYEWFEKIMNTEKFDVLFTAHHADDNFETFLINSIRGTGLKGLTGIPETNGRIIRPLLAFSRKEIQNFAETTGVCWREDSSNATSKYLRNKIRHKIIPILKLQNPSLLESFKKTHQYLQQTSELVEEYREVLIQEMVEKKGENFHLNIQKIQQKSCPKAILYQLLKDYGFTAWDDIYELLTSQTGKILFSPQYRLLKNREELILSKINSKESENTPIEVDEMVSLLNFPEGKLHFKISERVENTSKNEIFIDKNQIKFPLELRKWKESDYFYPFGMKGKKKVAKFLKDEKFSIYEKESVWVLTSEGKIIWIVGYRADERFRINKNIDEVLQINFHAK